MRMEEESSKCPQCFFFLPADTRDWSTLKKVDCFSIFTENMHLFFVCRVFFEELRVAADRAEAAKNDLTGTSSSEVSDPINLQMPRVRSLLRQRVKADDCQLFNGENNFGRITPLTSHTPCALPSHGIKGTYRSSIYSSTTNKSRSFDVC